MKKIRNIILAILIVLNIFILPMSVTADLVPVDVYSTSETIVGGTATFVVSVTLYDDQSFYLEYDPNVLEYIQETYGALYDYQNYGGRIIVTRTTKMITGDGPQHPYIEFKVLNANNSTTSVIIDSENDLIKNALYGGFTREISIAQANNTTNPTDSECEECKNNVEDNNDTLSQTLTWVSYSANAVLLGSLVYVLLRKPKLQ